MEDRATAALNRLLRCELTAVNQQFTHVLALRVWGDEATAARIMEVDEVDFPNAMRIIDHLLESGAPITLAPDRFTPGNDRASILAAEQGVEGRLCESLEEIRRAEVPTPALIAAAEAPRAAYAAWLRDQRDKEEASRNSAGAGGREPLEDATGDLLAHLLALIEQAMVHAFLHRHRGTTENADAAWATSGAAMMLATDLVELLAARRALPAPGQYPELRIAGAPEQALDFDRSLAAGCAALAERVLRADRAGAAAGVFEKTRTLALALAGWVPGQPHPAAASNPPAFASFQATLARYVLPG